jgi:hypothetical protein
MRTSLSWIWFMHIAYLSFVVLAQMDNKDISDEDQDNQSSWLRTKARPAAPQVHHGAPWQQAPIG